MIPQHSDWKSDALPIELQSHIKEIRNSQPFVLHSSFLANRRVFIRQLLGLHLISLLVWLDVLYRYDIITVANVRPIPERARTTDFLFGAAKGSRNLILSLEG